MPAPQFQPLEPRRLRTALYGSDVGWGRDGVVSRSEQNVYLGRVGRGFDTIETPFGNGGVGGYRVRRYGDSGKLTATFKLPGVPDFNEFGVDDQGRIVAAASNPPDDDVISVRRFTADGKVDEAFGDHGVATLASVVDPLGSGDGGSDQVYDLASDRRGAVFLYRSVYHAGDFTTGIVTKLRPDGTPDATFGDGGNVALPGSFGALNGTFIGVDRAGRVLAAASETVDGTSGRFTVTRLLPDGTVDRTYGRSGTFSGSMLVRITDGGDGIAIDPRGRLLVGDRFTKSNRTVIGQKLHRITEDGRLDTDFGTRGDAATTITPSEYAPNSVLVMADGTLTAQLGTSVWRLGDDGLALSDRGPAVDRDVEALVGVTSDGALLGRTFVSPGGETVARVVPLARAAVGRTGRLYLYGDDADDTFRLRRGSNDNVLYVDHNGTRVGVFKNVVSVNADLRDGDNVLLDRYLPNTLDLPMTVTSGAGRDSIYAGAGDDAITPGPGDDTVYAGPGDDTLTGETDFRTTGDDHYDLGTGNDTASDIFGRATILGGAGDDTIGTGYQPDVLLGGAGDDLLTPGDGNNVVYGDAGNDTIRALAGNDRLYGGTGNDRIDAGRGDDRVYGNDVGTADIPSAHDFLFGGAGADRVRRESDLDELDGFERVLP